MTNKNTLKQYETKKSYTTLSIDERKTMSHTFLEPFTFKNGLTLKNRVVMAPMTTSAGTPEGNVSEEELIYYLVRSSGASAVITACAYISSEGQAFNHGMGISRDTHIKTLKKLAEIIQLQGAKAICQIYHGGRMAQPHLISGRQPVSPSAIRAERKWAVTPKELTDGGITILINQFGKAVKRAIDAGFDGVELHGANTYLLQQFLSPHSNRRTDLWGGSLENRMSFPLEVIRHCKEIIQQHSTKPFLLGYRLSPEEVEEPGLRLDDTLVFTEALIGENIDYLHLSVQHYFQPSLIGIRNYKDQIPNIISTTVNGRIPLIGVGTVRTPTDADKVMEYAELVALGRQLVVDPKWIEKIEEGHPEKIHTEINLSSQHELYIPAELWNQIVSIPNWFPVKRNS